MSDKAVDAVQVRAGFWTLMYLILAFALAWLITARCGLWWGCVVELGSFAVFSLAHVISHTIVWTQHKVEHRVNPYTNKADE